MRQINNAERDNIRLNIISMDQWGRRYKDLWNDLDQQEVIFDKIPPLCIKGERLTYKHV